MRIFRKAHSVSPTKSIVGVPLPPGKKLDTSCPPAPPAAPSSTATLAAGRNLDVGEDILIEDFGPGGRMRNNAEETVEGSGVTVEADESGFGSTAHTESGRFDPQTFLGHRVKDAQGLRRRVVYDPTDIARVLQPRRSGCSNTLCNNNVKVASKGSSAAASAGAAAGPPGPAPSSAVSIAPASAPARDVPELLDRMASILETALDADRPGRESLLICKAVTDAYLVNAHCLVGAIAGDGKTCEHDYLVRALNVAWQHAVEHWNGDSDEPHSAADLHVAASWFQAWCAADDTGGQPTMNTYKLHDMLPGDWVWVLDHLEIAGAPEG